MEKKSTGIGRGGGRRLSMPQSGFMDKDEEKVQSKSNKARVYDKMPQSGEISPLDRIASLENTIKNLNQASNEGVQQHSDMIQQYKCNLTEHSLKRENEMLLKELEMKNQRAEEWSVENARLKKQVEELSEKNAELQTSSRAMEEEKQGQILDLQDQLSSLAAAKMFFEEETKSLQSEMDRRTSVLEKEKVNLEGILRDLEIDLESSSAIEEERQVQIAHLRNQLFDSAKAVTCLEQKNNSLVTGMTKCREENDLLQRRIRDFDFEVNCLKKDLEYKDVRLREWIQKVDSHLLENGKLKRDIESKDIRLQALIEKVESHMLENNNLKKDIESKDVRFRELTEKVNSQLLDKGKEKCVHESESEKANSTHKKPKANGEIERKTAQAKSMSEKRTPRELLKERKTPKQVGGREMPWRW